MTRRVFHALAASALLLIGSTQTVGAATHLRATFTQHFSGGMGGTTRCVDDHLICGVGMVDGYGRATDAFDYSDEEGFTHTIVLADGSRLTTQLDFVSRTTPGTSTDTPGASVSLGNPEDLLFDAIVTTGSGVFAGASGQGTVLLEQAGNVDQISISLDLD